MNAFSTRSVASRSARVTPLSTWARSTRRSSSILAVTARPAAVSEIVFARRSCGSSSRRARPAAHSWSSRRTSDGPSMPTCSARVPWRTPSPRRPAISNGVAQASDTLYAVSTVSLVRRHLRAVSTSRLLTARRRSCRLVMGEMIGAKTFDSKLSFLSLACHAACPGRRPVTSNLGGRSDAGQAVTLQASGGSSCVACNPDRTRRSHVAARRSSVGCRGVVRKMRPG
ncbi:hypothetical protein BDI4_590041 [Burkholderia diffusa]|nr:hypothetical protein BDI4_590041 [Burkholderia diffusa]